MELDRRAIQEREDWTEAWIWRNWWRDPRTVKRLAEQAWQRFRKQRNLENARRQGIAPPANYFPPPMHRYYERQARRVEREARRIHPGKENIRPAENLND